MKSPSVSTSNNFDFLRFFAAFLVMFSHSFALSGRDDWFLHYVGHEGGGGVAVSIFFVISGYLITASYLNNSNLKSYFTKRILRIYPAFIVSVLFCAFIIGPAMTTFTLHDYFSARGFWRFLRNVNLFYQHLQLPGTYKTLPVPLVNGSYWTLPIECALYIAIAFLGKMRLITKPYALLYITATCFMFHMWMEYRVSEPFGIYTYYGIRNMAMFFAGACLYYYREHIPVTWPSFILVALVELATFKHPHAYCIFFGLLPYFIVSFAYLPSKMLSNWGKYGDFSYGIYLYAFPMQQMVISTLGVATPVWEIVSISFVLTLVLAILSWKLVEQPMLRLKKHPMHKVA